MRPDSSTTIHSSDRKRKVDTACETDTGPNYQEQPPTTRANRAPLTPSQRTLADIGLSPGFTAALENGKLEASRTLPGVSYQVINRGPHSQIIKVTGPYFSFLIKVVTPKATATLQSEFNSGRNLNSEYFVHGTDILVTPDRAFGAMMKVDDVGTSDLMFIIEEQPQSINGTFCQSLYELLNNANEFLTTIHSEHRDLKPENIIILPNGKYKIIDHETMRLKDDHVGPVVGTPFYFSLMTHLQYYCTQTSLKEDFHELTIEEMNYDKGSTACIKMLFASMALHNETSAGDNTNHPTTFFMAEFLPARQALVKSLVMAIHGKFTPKNIADFNEKRDHYFKVMNNICHDIQSTSNPLHDARSAAIDELSHFETYVNKLINNAQRSSSSASQQSASTAPCSHGVFSSKHSTSSSPHNNENSPNDASSNRDGASNPERNPATINSSLAVT